MLASGALASTLGLLPSCLPMRDLDSTASEPQVVDPVAPGSAQGGGGTEQPSCVLGLRSLGLCRLGP